MTSQAKPREVTSLSQINWCSTGVDWFHSKGKSDFTLHICLCRGLQIISDQSRLNNPESFQDLSSGFILGYSVSLDRRIFNIQGCNTTKSLKKKPQVWAHRIYIDLSTLEFLVCFSAIAPQFSLLHTPAWRCKSGQGTELQTLPKGTELNCWADVPTGQTRSCRYQGPGKYTPSLFSSWGCSSSKSLRELVLDCFKPVFEDELAQPDFGVTVTPC